MGEVVGVAGVGSSQLYLVPDQDTLHTYQDNSLQIPNRYHRNNKIPYWKILRKILNTVRKQIYCLNLQTAKTKKVEFFS